MRVLKYIHHSMGVASSFTVLNATGEIATDKVDVEVGIPFSCFS
jgi:hypothetical protein